jgi:bacteriocin-like protein
MEFPRELTDNELDAVSGGAVAVGASSSSGEGGALAQGGAGASAIAVNTATEMFAAAFTNGPSAAVGVF